MSFLSIFNGVKRLDLSEFDPECAGFWVDIRRALSGKESDAVSRALLHQKLSQHLDKDGEFLGSEIAGEFNAEEATRLRLIFGIAAWNLDGPDGPLPLDTKEQREASIAALPGPVRTYIAAEITKLHNPKRRTPETEADFRNADHETAAGSAAGVGTA